MALVTLSNIRTPATAGWQFQLQHWALQRGENWVVLGGNGAGKTHLVNILLGQQALSRGERSYEEGFDPKANVSFISFERQHQLYALDDRFDDSELREDVNDKGTTVSSLLAKANNKAALSAISLEQFDFWLDQLGLQELLNEGIRSLSTGQMRKVLLMQALVAGSDVLILDDPLAGLDRQTQADFTTLLDALFAKIETVLVLLNEVEQIPAAATHMLLLDNGRVIYQGVNDVDSRVLAAKTLQHYAVMPQQLPLASSLLLDCKQPLIEMHSVSASYSGKPVFSDFNWTLQYGQHAKISGPNGCGKSTLLSLINGENAMAYGQDITLFGRRKGSGESIWELKKHFGTVSTALQTRYVRGFTVLEVVMSGFNDSVGLYEELGDMQKNIALQWVELVGLTEQLKHRFKTLSYGQQRLALLARAMVKRPHILILDELCIGLDEGNRQYILQLLDYIAENSETHILYVSHVVGDEPQCINQYLDFELLDANNSDSAYKITVRSS